jgi:hypothetical protein
MRCDAFTVCDVTVVLVSFRWLLFKFCRDADHLFVSVCRRLVDYILQADVNMFMPTLSSNIERVDTLRIYNVY